jgi:hypothetical protein
MWLGKEGKEGVGARHLSTYKGNSSMWLSRFVVFFNRVMAGWSAVSSFAETVALMGSSLV